MDSCIFGSDNNSGSSLGKYDLCLNDEKELIADIGLI